jgi:hypothetical protein
MPLSRLRAALKDYESDVLSASSEAWSDVPGCPDYMVSSFGRVKRVRGAGSKGEFEAKVAMSGRFSGRAVVRSRGRVVAINVASLVLEVWGPTRPSARHFARRVDDEGPFRIDNLVWREWDRRESWEKRRKAKADRSGRHT